MKKLLITLGLLLSINSVSAAPYTQENPDCSKSETFISDISKKGFLSILKFEDNINNVSYILFNNFKTSQDILISIKNDKSKICIVFLSYNETTEFNLPPLRDFLDNLVKDAK
jgi:hypothetical protein